MPAKIHAVLALKACRISVMVGNKLEHQKMRDLVDHLHRLKKPWICAHGRPTIRYIMNLDEYRGQLLRMGQIGQRSPPKLHKREEYLTPIKGDFKWG